ncbi:MAG: threonine--tRNA ligase [Patescibacteria group bacterium]
MSEDTLFTIRHSTAHVLAKAVMELYPSVKLGVGPVIENGFFYDIAFPEVISEDVLPAIEAKMHEILKRKDTFRREEMSIDEAIAFFKKVHQDFKVELLQDLKEKGTTKVNPEEAMDIDTAKPDVASVYYTGDFVDLCRGPHVANTSEISGAFKLTKLAGAYWRGDEKNPQLTRIYGVAFATQDELDAYLIMIEEAKKRDHRKLGQELDLFAFSPLVGSGLPLFTPKGTIVRKLLEDFVSKLMKPYGYSRVDIPHMAKVDLYKTSGHYEKFADDIFHVSSKKSDDEFIMKPMNCPHHTQIYASRPRSYRDLPIRYSEVTKVYRDENTGQLAGLSRVRSITQDDAHIFCTLEQVKQEALNIYEIITQFYAKFDMPLRIRLSVHDPKYMEKYLGSNETWETSVGILRNVLDGLKKEYEVGVGEAAFYGPKIDFIAKYAIGREWQLATIQLDFNLPERFELEYADADGTKKRPVMVHRAISGSLERFMSVLIEHYAGAFPLWLAPVQVRLAPVGEAHLAFCEKLKGELVELDVRVDLDDSGDKVGAKIRRSAGEKIPWTLVIGDKEVGGEPFNVRVFGQEEALDLDRTALIVELKKHAI